MKTKKAIEGEGATEQFNGREGETATLLSRCVVSFSLREFGFAPRHLNRWAAIVKREAIAAT